MRAAALLDQLVSERIDIGTARNLGRYPADRGCSMLVGVRFAIDLPPAPSGIDLITGEECQDEAPRCLIDKVEPHV